MAYRELVQTVTGLTIATTAYSNGDQLGNLITFPNAVTNRGTSTNIVSAFITDASSSQVLGGVDLILLNTAPANAGDNNPASFTTTELRTARAALQWTNANWIKFATNQYAQWQPTHGPMNALNSLTSTNLYGILITRSNNAVFTTSTDIQVGLTVDVF